MTGASDKTPIGGSVPLFSASPIQKNSWEELHVDLTQYNGHNLVSLRVFYERDGQQLPGKQGLSVRASAIPDLIDRLQVAEAEAIRLGLITGRGGN